MLVRAGLLRPLLPSQLITVGRVLAKWGTGPAGGFHACAVLDPDREGIVDERGSSTWGEMHRRSNALARALAERGVREGDAVVLWWRDDDGDLVDGLVDALTDLVGGGSIWLLTPKVGRPGAVDAADIAEAAPIAGLAQTTTAAVSKDWTATRLVAPKSRQ